MISEDDRLLDSGATADFNEVAVLLDCPNQRMGQIGVINELIAEKLERGAQNRRGSHDKALL